MLDPQLDLSYWYQLIGVVVHTGTAEGGHYYSFILDRSSPQGRDQWFLFNDAEVKPFDPAQIAAECFGGEMTVTLDIHIHIHIHIYIYFFFFFLTQFKNSVLRTVNEQDDESVLICSDLLGSGPSVLL